MIIKKRDNSQIFSTCIVHPNRNNIFKKFRGNLKFKCNIVFSVRGTHAYTAVCVQTNAA